MAAFVGRERELAALVAALVEPPAVAVVEGEAGIGKTRLVAELPGALRTSGRRFLVGGCRAIREPFPLGPVLEAVGGQRAGWEPAALSPVVGALRPLLPELADLLPPPPEPLEDRGAQRHRVFRALVAVLGAVGPVVLVLEDLHWADEQTIDFLRYLLDDPPPSLSLAVTFRGEDIDPAVRALLRRLPPAVGRAHLLLTPLDADQTGELAAAIVGVEQVSADFAAYLRERTGGLPFAIEEVMALLRERGQVVRWGRRWARRTLETLAVPTAIRDHVLARAALLPAPAQPVLAAAAVLHRAAPEDLIAAVAGAPPADAVTGASLAIHTGLLVESGDGVGFRHPLAAQAIYDDIPGPQRRALHDRAAAALRERGPAALGQVAYHLHRAGRLAEWADAAERAADLAMELGHDDEAARLLEDVVRHAALEPARHGQVAVKLGRAAMMALHASEDVVDLLAGALAVELPRAVRGELRLRLSQLLERFGTEFGRQRDLLTQAIEDLDDRPDLMASAMLALGFPVVPREAAAEHRTWLQRVLRIVPAIDDPAFQVFLLGKVAMVQVATGDPQWSALTRQIVDRVGGTPRRAREVNAYYSVGLEACYAGHLETARQLLAGGRDGAVAAQSDQLEVRIRAATTLLDYCRGVWDGLADRVELLIDQLGDHAPSRTDAEVVSGCLALARGELDRALRVLSPLPARLAQHGGFDLLSLPVNALVRLAVSRGDAAAAREVVDHFLTTIESVPFEVSALRALPAVTQALVRDGRGGQARELVARWAKGVAELDAPLAPAALAHARGFLTAAEPSTAAGHFVAAARVFGRLGCPYEAAQAYEQAAVIRLSAGSPDGDTDGDADGSQAAGGELRSTLATYQRLGATWDLGRASGLARRYRISVPARHRGGHRGYGGDLSPRERQVAELAAAGQTNKEIAADLFLSPETVKSQLQSAMRKLGVRTRVALSRQLRDHDHRD